jgi:hypothetical protein
MAVTHLLDGREIPRPQRPSGARWGAHTGVLSTVPDTLDDLNSALDQWRMAGQFDSAEIVPGDGPPYAWTVRATRGEQTGEIVLTETLFLRAASTPKERAQLVRIVVEQLDAKIAAAETKAKATPYAGSGLTIRQYGVGAPGARFRIRLVLAWRILFGSYSRL